MMGGRFLVNFLKNPLRNASIVPSSRYAASKMLAGIDFEAVRYVVELGPGTGVFTQEILNRVHSDAEVLAIELEESYIEKLEFFENPQFEVIQGSACGMRGLVQEKGWPKVDLVISSLPFVLPVDVKEKLFTYLQECTQNGTTFRWFTYLPALMKPHYREFGFELHGFVPRNFPPMWIYTVN